MSNGCELRWATSNSAASNSAAAAHRREPSGADAGARAGSLGCLVPGLAALGVALVELAVGAGGPAPVGVLFVALGAAHLGWAVWLLAGDRVRMPGAALAFSLLGVLGWAPLLLLSPGAPDLAAFLRPVPLAAIAGLNLFIAFSLVLQRRRIPPGAQHPAPAGWYIACLIVSATALSAIVTPALAATRAGDAAAPHGGHPGLELPARHEH